MSAAVALARKGVGARRSIRPAATAGRSGWSGSWRSCSSSPGSSSRRYGVAGIQGLAISVLPLALAAVAQAIVVISGGIDLSIGSMMALTSVVAAIADEGPGGSSRSPSWSASSLLGLVLGAINGVSSS